MSWSFDLTRACALRLEAAWWLLRPHFFSPVVLGLAGLYAVDGSPSAARVVGVVVGVAATGALVQIVNDLSDWPKDATSAPYLPIPAGLLSIRAARLAAVAAMLLIAGSIVVASDGSMSRLVALGVLVLSMGPLTWVYSVAKAHGILGPIVASVMYSLAPTFGVVVGGSAAGYAWITIVEPAMVMLLSNSWAALRDIDTDEAVGNRTVPVRLGAAPVLWVTSVCWALSLALLVALGSTRNHLVPAVAACSVLAFLLLRNVTSLVRAFLTAGTRAQRTQQLRPLFQLNALRAQLLLVLVAPMPGLIVSLLMHSLSWAQRKGYDQRIIHGGIQASLTRLAKATT